MVPGCIRHYCYLNHELGSRQDQRTSPARAGLSGIRSMLLAAAVLFLAWMTAEIIAWLGVGEYMAGLIGGGLAFSLLPAILFALACFISFSMGSTFGTFGLILPIAAEIVVSIDLSLLIPAFGAVLAGAIFGDHTSPLSDTTILSSIGSGIHLIDHVTTQIPYALVCARSEEHTSELQSRQYLVCRLLLEKK